MTNQDLAGMGSPAGQDFDSQRSLRCYTALAPGFRMQNVDTQSPVVRFGLFEVDLHTGEIRRAGRKVRLQEQPFQILAMLLERPGDMVSRQQLQERLWPTESVDFDGGLNKAIKKLREALEDPADNPRFVQTLPRRGYRFIAPVEKDVVYSALRPERSLIDSIAVLPLENLSGAQDYFADAMTDELITEIAKISSLRVISRTSVMHYKGVHKPLAAIARELGVDAVVEGTIVHSGQKVRITARLIRAFDDRHLWSEKYERDLGDVLTLQGEVAQAIAGRIHIRLTPQEHTRLARARPVNPQAHLAYLEGTHFRNRWTEEALLKSIELFSSAIELDSAYAQGYAGLSHSYCALGILGSRPSGDVYSKARAAALKALELDETIAEAHNTLAEVKKGYDWDWNAAEAGYKRAVELSPSYAIAHTWYADLLSKMGRHEEAILEATRARELDPISANSNAFLGFIFYRARKYDEALPACRKAVELDQYLAEAHWFLALVYQQKRKLPNAVAQLEKAVSLSGGESFYRALLAQTYALVGERAKTLSILDELNALARQRYVSPLDIAIIYTGLGNNNLAFDWLEKAYQERTMRIQELPQPIFHSLRSDPRFHDLMQRIGLPA